MKVTVEELEPPYEILELRDRQSLVLTVVDYKVGTVLIHPRYLGAPPEKRIGALRVFVPGEEKVTGMPYWDLTSSTLVAQLSALMPDLKERRGKVRITAFGVAPSKRFQVEVL